MGVEFGAPGSVEFGRVACVVAVGAAKFGSPGLIFAGFRA